MTGDSQVVRMESANQKLRDAFLYWQCRIRQIAVRQDDGKPSEGMVPDVYLDGADEPLGSIVTIMSRRPEFSQTMELRHMARRTADPAERREAAIKFLSERYYQGYREFSPVVTATFVPESAGAKQICAAKECRLVFEQFEQRYDLPCEATALSSTNWLYDATFWHNYLFNPNLSADAIIVGFEADWANAIVEPSPL